MNTATKVLAGVAIAGAAYYGLRRAGVKLPAGWVTTAPAGMAAPPAPSPKGAPLELPPGSCSVAAVKMGARTTYLDASTGKEISASEAARRANLEDCPDLGATRAAAGQVAPTALSLGDRLAGAVGALGSALQSSVPGMGAPKPNYLSRPVTSQSPPIYVGGGKAVAA